MPALVLGLVWRLPDGTLLEEPWQYGSYASRADALSAARCDGIAGGFGRTFLGVLTIESMHDADPWRTRTIEERHAPSLADLDAAVADAGVDAREEPALNVLPVAAMEHTPWWQHDCAFGSGTLLGVSLRRCLARDEETATTNAELVGECMAHQQTLYGATAHALEVLPDVLPLMSAPVRATLSAWLEVVADSAKDRVRDGPIATVKRSLARTLLRGGSPAWMVDHLVEQALRHQDAVRACRAAIAKHSTAYLQLSARGMVGPTMRALARSLARTTR